MSPNSGAVSKQLQLVRNLRSATMDAISAARIDDAASVRKALDRRDQLLKQLWGFSPDEKLPTYSHELAKQRGFELDDQSREVMEEVNHLESQLLRFMNYGLGRLQQQNNDLSVGRRAMQGLRAATSVQSGSRRLDVQG